MSVSISSTGLNNLIKQNKKMLDSTTKTYKKSLDNSKKLVKNHEKIYKLNKDMNNETLRTLKKQENSMKIMEKLSLKIKNIFATIGKMGWIALLGGAVAGLGMIFGGMNAKRNKYKNEATATEEKLGMAKGTLYQEVKGRNANYIGNGLYDKYDNVSKLNGFRKVNGTDGQQLFERLFDIRRQYKEYKETGQTTEDLNSMMKYGSDYLEDLLATNDINKMIDIFKNTAKANSAYGADILNSTLLNNTGYDYNGLMRLNTKFGFERDEHETEADNPFMEAIRWLKEEFMKSNFVRTVTECLQKLVTLFRASLQTASKVITKSKTYGGYGLETAMGVVKNVGTTVVGGITAAGNYITGNTDTSKEILAKTLEDNTNNNLQIITASSFSPERKQQLIQEEIEMMYERISNMESRYNMKIDVVNNDTSVTLTAVKR